MSGFTVCCGFWESDKFTAAASVLWPGDLYYRASGEGTIENNLNSFTVENLYNFIYVFLFPVEPSTWNPCCVRSRRLWRSTQTLKFWKPAPRLTTHSAMRSSQSLTGWILLVPSCWTSLLTNLTGYWRIFYKR